MNDVLVAALYKFVHLKDYKELRPRIEKRCQELGVKGILLLASEGINGTIAGTPDSVKEFLAYLKSDIRFKDLSHKESRSIEMPFRRLKVRLKNEIVTMGVDGIDPTSCVGTYIEPKDWNQLITDPAVVLVDTRNDYEIEIGTFQGAIDPQTTSFREFPEWSQEAPELKGKTRVAMFCTGGIRCEKASSYLLQQGIEEVYHLKGGILKYLEEIPEEESLWHGECFVFDERIAVDHDLNQGTHVMCYGCRRPVSETGRSSEKYIEGVSCSACYDTLTDDQRERFSERHRQILLAAARKEQHLGPTRAPQRETTLARRDFPVLYSFRRCPYAIRARMAIVASGLKVELREILLRDKPEHLLELSPKGTVPVLWLPDGAVIEESLEIMDWALSQQDAHPWMRCRDTDRPLLDSLLSENDGSFKKHLNKFKYANRQEGQEQAEYRTLGETFLKKLEARLRAQPFLQGDHFGHFDASILPFIRQFAGVDKVWFAEAPYPHLRAWLENGLMSSEFVQAMVKKPIWESGTLGCPFPTHPVDSNA